MDVYGEAMVAKFARKYPAARKPLQRFLKIARAAKWRHFPDMKQTFAATDYSPSTGTLIFDVGENKYRLVARVDFGEQILFHSERQDTRKIRPGGPLMPMTYEELLLETAPQIIETEKQYREAAGRFGELVGKGRARTKSETKIMRLLALLIEDYDRRHAMPPDEATPSERLRFLLDHSGKTPTDLLPVFGQRSHVNEALNGKRRISAEQARRLGDLFRVAAGLFI